MHLTLHTQYALRSLLHLATAPSAISTAGAIATAHHLSKNHLMKVLQRLRDLGYVETVRGRGGGVRLARSPSEITLGTLIRQTERLGDPPDQGRGLGSPKANATEHLLRRRLDEAMVAYAAELDRHTLADMSAACRPAT